jgi:hypothetical protein
MANYKKTILIAFSFLITLISEAQSGSVSVPKEEMGFMRSEGKIYVVMVVVVTILIGLILYLFRLDRKLSKLEKDSNL